MSRQEANTPQQKRMSFATIRVYSFNSQLEKGPFHITSTEEAPSPESKRSMLPHLERNPHTTTKEEPPTPDTTVDESANHN